MNNEDWHERIQEIRDALAPLAAELPVMVAESGPNLEGARTAYKSLDTLSEQVAVLLDEMDDADAPEELIDTCETLLETIEELRNTLSAKLTRKRERRP